MLSGSLWRELADGTVRPAPPPYEPQEQDEALISAGYSPAEIAAVLDLSDSLSGALRGTWMMTLSGLSRCGRASLRTSSERGERDEDLEALEELLPQHLVACEPELG